MDRNDFEHIDLLQIFTAAVANGAAGKPSAELDFAAFLHLLDDTDAPEAEKLELLSVISDIMAAYVDMGFGIHPVQQAGGQVSERDVERSDQGSELLKSEFNERKLE